MAVAVVALEQKLCEDGWQSAQLLLLLLLLLLLVRSWRLCSACKRLGLFIHDE